MTRAPAAASASAVARPMPRDAPVTRAVLLARLAMMVFSMRWYRRRWCRTMPASVRGHAAVNVEDLAGNPLGCVRTDENDAVGDFLGEAETIERNVLLQGRLVLCRAGESGQHAGVGGAGRDGIHTNPRLS